MLYVNDLIVQGAKPFIFFRYCCWEIKFKKTKKIINGIFKGCGLSECSLIGGETAEMPGVYAKDKFDLSWI